jgi:molybdate transport system regulatory protein
VDDFLTADQAARLLRLHVKRVQVLARAGRIPAMRVGRKWLFSRAALEARLGADEAPHARVEISGRNQLRGTVTAITLGDVMAEVRARIGEQEVVSIITRSSVERLGLKVGDGVLVIIKATDVMIGRL